MAGAVLCMNDWSLGTPHLHWIMGKSNALWTHMIGVGVSLMAHEVSNIFSRNLGIMKIGFLMRISSWNFVYLPREWLWTHMQSSSLKFSPQMWFLALYIFARLFWRAWEMLVKQPPGHWPLAACCRRVWNSGPFRASFKVTFTFPCL